MMMITEIANAKINLSLDVLTKRADGYHEIRTIFQSLALADILRFTKTDNSQIELSSSDSELPVGKENLVWQAAKLLQEHYGVTGGVQIRLDKRIPVAAGLGGGSSDAAATLRALVRLWQLPKEDVLLHAIAARLGSDVPFCLHGGTALGTGRGEILQPVFPCPHFYVVLANPGIAVSTALVYQGYKPGGDNRPATDSLLTALSTGERDQVVAHLGNGLESSTFALYPEVARLKERMGQVGPALMCGSGATVFALFSEKNAAEALHNELKNEGIQAWLTETAAKLSPGGEEYV